MVLPTVTAYIAFQALAAAPYCPRIAQIHICRGQSLTWHSAWEVRAGASLPTFLPRSSISPPRPAPTTAAGRSVSG